ncbi:hypothetical protein [Pseudomonas syringae]|uniref:hypothetical protein n=1 Tax=Pseudomonas syringae TaxID=317 RepID=UPI00200A15C8|nr:hypothetical protein [Pseudomonas syringae]MCK9705012.1 hypothetical protein [Pseudomonas syringae pv. syringae]
MSNIEDGVDNSNTAKPQGGWALILATLSAFRKKAIEEANEEQAKRDAIKARIIKRNWHFSVAAVVCFITFMGWFLKTVDPYGLQSFFVDTWSVVLFLLAVVSFLAMTRFIVETKSFVSFKEVDDASISSRKHKVLTADHFYPKNLNYYRRVSLGSSGAEVNKRETPEPNPSGQDDLERELSESEGSSDAPVVDEFVGYVREAISAIDSQIDWMERKGSVLLDKGRASMRNGIIFYVLTIIGWQVYAWIVKEVTDVMIYGIISCSLAFLVMEFSAAWFLREYRSFVAASSHLFRLKSIYNRYLLSYLGIKEFSSGDKPGLIKMRAELLKVLAQDVVWPGSFKGRAADHNHMVEMFSSFTDLLAQAKDVLKSPAGTKARSGGGDQ